MASPEAVSVERASPEHISRLHARALEHLRAGAGGLAGALGRVRALPPRERPAAVRLLLRRQRLLPLPPPPPAKCAARAARLLRDAERLAGQARRVAVNGAAAAAPLASPELACALAQQDPAPAPTPAPPLFRAPHDLHPHVPCASAKLALAHHSITGRRLLAAAPVAPGEVLAVEEPYVRVLLAPYFHRHCYHCCERRPSLIPCETCDSVMFCSETCRTAACDQYHGRECQLMYYTRSMGFSKLELSALRVVLKARGERTSWSELRKDVQKIEATEDPVKRGFVDEIYDSRNYSAVHCLETNVDSVEWADMFQKTFACAVLLDLLVEYSDVFKSDNGDEIVSFAGGLLLHHVLSATCNVHSIEGLYEDERTGFRESCDYACGTYAFMSLMNHSCNPNVIRQNVGTSTVLLCLRPIKEGEEVFDTYGPHFAFQEASKRREHLRSQYKFDCRCIACVENWPTYENLQTASSKSPNAPPDIGDKLTPELLAKLQRGDRTVVVYVAEELGKHLAALEEFIPCKELSHYQEVIKRCWGLLGNMFRFEN